MTVVQLRVHELNPEQLDACVAHLEGEKWQLDRGVAYSPSSDWSVGGPIIERERIAVAWLDSRWNAWSLPCSDRGYYGEYALDVHASDADATGPTPLVAAMRAYVRAKLGDVVELPV